MPVRYILSSVWVRLSIFSPLSIIWGCLFSVYPFPCDDWENIYTLSYYHHQIESMNYYPLFRVRSWNNGVRCMSFYILMGVNYFLSNGPHFHDALWSGISLGMRPANERRCYIVTTSLFGWAHTWSLVMLIKHSSWDRYQNLCLWISGLRIWRQDN